jgi:hypothetical protein
VHGGLVQPGSAGCFEITVFNTLKYVLYAPAAASDVVLHGCFFLAVLNSSNPGVQPCSLSTL